MNKKGLFLLPAALLSGAVMADTVSQGEAMDKALHFLQGPAKAPGHAQQQARLTLAHTAEAEGETYYYAFNNAAGGYVIVAGDDVARDVLAYGESGQFDYEELPPAMKWFLSQYEHQIHNAIHKAKAGKGLLKARAEAEERAEVKPLLGATEWNQDLPYNAWINDNTKEENSLLRYATGCVATSTAQVMRYWGHPKQGMGSYSYAYRGNNYAANFAQSEYRWDLMQDSYEKAYAATAEEDAVAQLMHDLGVALNMKYAQIFEGGSGAMSISIPYALSTFFGYSAEARHVLRDESMTEGQWEKLIYDELAEGRPVIYGGNDPEGSGHSFVCDGYKDGRFHINWGWGGKMNDYFLLTSTEAEDALHPDASGIGGNDYGMYSAHQEIVIGIQPDEKSEGNPYVTACDYNAEQPYEAFSITVKIYNPRSEKVMLLPVLMFDCTSEPNVQPLELGSNETEESQGLVVIPAKSEVTMTYEVTADMIGELIAGAHYECLLSDYLKLMTTMNASDLRVLTLFDMHMEGPSRLLIDIPEFGFRTLCLPFSVQLDVDDPVQAYEVKSIRGNVVSVAQTFVMEAGQSYLFMGEPNGKYLIDGETELTDGVVEGPFLTGLLSPYKQLMLGHYYTLSYFEDDHSPAFAPAEDVTVKPYTAVLRADVVDGEYDYLYVTEDETVGIQTIDEEKNGLVRFTLAGQRVTATHGLMIQNGRVVFRK